MLDIVGKWGNSQTFSTRLLATNTAPVVYEGLQSCLTVSFDGVTDSLSLPLFLLLTGFVSATRKLRRRHSEGPQSLMLTHYSCF
jgi:hypothetical protein